MRRPALPVPALLVPTLLVSASAGLVLVGCGGGSGSGPSRDALIAKLKTEGGAQTLVTDKNAGCLADVLRTYEPPQVLSDYVAGKYKDSDDVPEPKESAKAEAAAVKCLGIPSSVPTASP